MSGSGGGSWPTPTGDSCERLTSETTLTSPDRAVISQLTDGTLLSVEVDTSGARPVVRAMYQGQVAGSITSSIIQRLVECIDDGHEYVAEVLSVQGGTCRVRVRSR
jgi:hypothetical protein